MGGVRRASIAFEVKRLQPPTSRRLPPESQLGPHPGSFGRVATSLHKFQPANYRHANHYPLNYFTYMQPTWSIPMSAASSDHPYSPAKRAGSHIYVSGALSVDADYIPVPGRREALDAALTRMTERLATAGGTREDVVKLTYYVTDLSLREEANQQFIEVFSGTGAARTFLEVSRLPYGATVEIDAIAVKTSGEE